MTDVLYPVPREPGVADGRSRLLPAAAEVTAQGVLRGREQAAFGVVAPSRLLTVPVAEVTAKGVLRAAVQPDPFVVARPRLVNAPVTELTATGILRGRDQAVATVAASRVVSVSFAELTSATTLRGARHAIGAERLPRLIFIPPAAGGGITGTASITLDPLTALGAGTVLVRGLGAPTLGALTTIGGAAGRVAITGSGNIVLAPATLLSTTPLFLGIQPTGIPSRRGLALPGLKPLPVGASGAAVTAHANAMLQAITALQQRLDAVDSLLARRINEMMLSGPLAARPAPGIQDRLFIATDQTPGANAYYDTGSAWVPL